MKSYDKWVTEGDDHTCDQCGYVYTSADGGCTPCEAWKEAVCEEIYHLAEQLNDTELIHFLCDGEAMSLELSTREKWLDLLDQTRARTL